MASMAEASVLQLWDTVWYGSPGPTSAAAAMMAKAWYANAAATGSTPSLYQDDLLDGPVSALLPEPPPPLNAAAIAAGPDVDSQR
ncbi:hypothetical protein MNEG_15323 [Monoraphidium neglectum]|uniref:Uncharacterized protein n=1 Tax=Monoraphidium neglectum TaxID=145388 RepID=A0A0D2LS36_9CHLO|nr:hypothetical protein MNEG_15323 [Monoraphidium neglectum]KIY92641.1 hypothetical protein MNEG_15323 [Monoraphidium neglectum]|eukprot:XP_013891661.1 hypothetical protein MNEG_15323 [Monoraphidium neglectum]